MPCQKLEADCTGLIAAMVSSVTSSHVQGSQWHPQLSEGGAMATLGNLIGYMHATRDFHLCMADTNLQKLSTWFRYKT